MSIYTKPEEYAKTTKTTVEQAEKICKHFKEVNEVIYQAKLCPTCKQRTLEFEGGSYEGGYGDYIYCENDCGYTSDIIEKYIPLVNGFDFDVVLMNSFDIVEKGLEESEKLFGCSWEEFVNREIHSYEEVSKDEFVGAKE